MSLMSEILVGAGRYAVDRLAEPSTAAGLGIAAASVPVVAGSTDWTSLIGALISAVLGIVAAVLREKGGK